MIALAERIADPWRRRSRNPAPREPCRHFARRCRCGRSPAWTARSVALALGADALVLRHFHVLEHQRAGVATPSGRASPPCARPCSRAWPCRPRSRRCPCACRPTDRSPRTAPVLPRMRADADELLGAVDDVTVALLHRARAQIGGIGAGLRFGQRRTTRRPRRSPAGAASGPSARRCRSCRSTMQVGELCTETMRGNRAVAGSDLLQQQRVGDRIDFRAVPFGAGVVAPKMPSSPSSRMISGSIAPAFSRLRRAAPAAPARTCGSCRRRGCLPFSIHHRDTEARRQIIPSAVECHPSGRYGQRSQSWLVKSRSVGAHCHCDQATAVPGQLAAVRDGPSASLAMPVDPTCRSAEATT